MAEDSLSKEERATLQALGHAISISRRARNMRQKDLCDEAGIGVNTMVAIEKGVETVQIGHYIRVMHVLGRLEPIRRAAEIGCDELGAREMAEGLPKRAGAGRRK